MFILGETRTDKNISFILNDGTEVIGEITWQGAIVYDPVLDRFTRALMPIQFKYNNTTLELTEIRLERGFWTTAQGRLKLPARLPVWG